MRRWTHWAPIARHSSQPAAGRWTERGVSAVTCGQGFERSIASAAFIAPKTTSRRRADGRSRRGSKKLEIEVARWFDWFEKISNECCYALQDKVWIEDPDGN